MGPQERLFNKNFRWEAANKNFSITGNQCNLSPKCQKTFVPLFTGKYAAQIFSFSSKYNVCKIPWTENYIAMYKSQRLFPVLQCGEVNRWSDISFSFSFLLCFYYSICQGIEVPMHEFLGRPEKPAVFNNLSGWMTAISVLWPQFYLLIILFLRHGGRSFRLVFQKLGPRF